MTLSLLPLGSLPPKPSFWESIIYQSNGLLIVFTVLGSLWMLMEIAGYLFRLRGARRANIAQPAKQVSADQVSADDIALETIAVIAAAVHTVLKGRAYRVVSVAVVPERDRAWAAEGRRDIFASRKVR